MDILPVNNVLQIIRSHGHHDQQPQKRQQPRKKDRSGTRSIYTPDGHIEEKRPPKIDVIG